MTIPPKVSDLGAAAAKLVKRQKKSNGVKPKYWQKEGYSQEDHKNNLTTSGFASTGPMSISQVLADRDEADAEEEERAASRAYQQELMARLRALTEGE